MPIPLEQGRLQKLAKQKRRLERQEKNTTKDVRRLLYKARLHAVEVENGNEDAREDMLATLDAAIERGLSKDAIRSSGNMAARINALIDRPESQAHALGLLLNAVELLAVIDPQQATKVQAVVDTLDSSQDHKAWQEIATPTRRGI